MSSVLDIVKNEQKYFLFSYSRIPLLVTSIKLGHVETIDYNLTLNYL